MGAGPELDPAAARSAASFQRAVDAVRGARMRSEVLLDEVPAPQRIAPYATAVGADVTLAADPAPREVGTGRLVLLHDPAGTESWSGCWRCVTFVRADVDPEMVRDPMLSGVAWSWLTEAWQSRGLDVVAPSGTVTAVLSEGFGGIEADGLTAQVEVRASWTPVATGLAGGAAAEGAADPAAVPDVRAHVEAWGDLLCSAAGLPPVPAGVVALTPRAARGHVP